MQTICTVFIYMKTMYYFDSITISLILLNISQAIAQEQSFSVLLFSSMEEAVTVYV